MSATIIRNDLKTWLDDMPNRYKQIKSEWKGFVIRSEKILQNKAPIGATSNLFNSIPSTTEISVVGTDFYGKIGSDLDYSYSTMETGLPPGTVVDASKGSALDRWAKTKGLNAYAVAKSIKRKGTVRFRTKERLVTRAELEIDVRETPKFMDIVSNILTK